MPVTVSFILCTALKLCASNSGAFIQSYNSAVSTGHIDCGSKTDLH